MDHNGAFWGTGTSGTVYKHDPSHEGSDIQQPDSGEPRLRTKDDRDPVIPIHVLLFVNLKNPS